MNIFKFGCSMDGRQVMPNRSRGPSLFPTAAPRGTALIVAMVIVLLLSGLSASLLMEMTTRSERTEVDAEDVKSFEAAEAGLDAAIRNLNTGGNGCIGLGWTSGS